MSAYLSSACLAERLCLCTWATRESGVVRSIPYVQFSHVYVLVGRNPKTTESALTFVSFFSWRSILWPHLEVWRLHDNLMQTIFRTTSQHSSATPYPFFVVDTSKHNPRQNRFQRDLRSWNFWQTSSRFDKTPSSDRQYCTSCLRLPLRTKTNPSINFSQIYFAQLGNSVLYLRLSVCDAVSDPAQALDETITNSWQMSSSEDQPSSKLSARLGNIAFPLLRLRLSEHDRGNVLAGHRRRQPQIHVNAARKCAKRTFDVVSIRHVSLTTSSALPTAS